MGVYTRKNPFFSIITCTLNAEKYLEENLGSVNRQTYTDFEHIIIDGMSTDNTIKVIDQFKKKFRNKIKVVSIPYRLNKFREQVCKRKIYTSFRIG